MIFKKCIFQRVPNFHLTKKFVRKKSSKSIVLNFVTQRQPNFLNPIAMYPRLKNAHKQFFNANFQNKKDKRKLTETLKRQNSTFISTAWNWNCSTLFGARNTDVISWRNAVNTRSWSIWKSWKEFLKNASNKQKIPI